MNRLGTSADKIKHLYYRAGFGMSAKEIEFAAHYSVDQAVNLLFEAAVGQDIAETNVESQIGLPQKQFTSFLDSEMVQMKSTMSMQDELEHIRNKWIGQMVEGPDLLEKMVYYWHTHFVCFCPTGSKANSYLNTLRTHALGNYKDLVLAVAKEPAMIRFLNNQQNRKEDANENFARELMELFTLGEGNYSESDVHAAARAFTGWSSNESGFVFRPKIHDFDEKTFRSKTGPWNGEDIIDIILEDKAAARFLAKKLYTFFVSDVTVESDLAQLADVIWESGYDIKSTLKFLFRADFFYEESNRGIKIKSPIELVVHIMKMFEIRFRDEQALTFLQRSMGQILLDPPNVAGWPGARNWINNATLMIRLNLVDYLLNQQRFDMEPVTSLEAAGPANVIQKLAVDDQMNPMLTLFSGTPNEALEESYKQVMLARVGNQILTKNKERKQLDYRRTLMMRITSLPEFQLC